MFGAESVAMHNNTASPNKIGWGSGTDIYYQFEFM
jgi:hypothetical protein